MVKPKYNFQEGDLVWAKVRNYPPWPAVVFDEANADEKVRKQKTKESTLVQFLGEHSFAWVKKSEILLPFREHYDEYATRKDTKQGVKAAIEEAVAKETAYTESGRLPPTLLEKKAKRAKPSKEEGGSDDGDSSKAESSSKRRGRPRKDSTSEKEKDEGQEEEREDDSKNETSPKRGRGRPRKGSISEKGKEKEGDDDDDDDDEKDAIKGVSDASGDEKETKKRKRAPKKVAAKKAAQTISSSSSSSTHTSSSSPEDAPVIEAPKARARKQLKTTEVDDDAEPRDTTPDASTDKGAEATPGGTAAGEGDTDTQNNAKEKKEKKGDSTNEKKEKKDDSVKEKEKQEKKEKKEREKKERKEREKKEKREKREREKEQEKEKKHKEKKERREKEKKEKGKEKEKESVKSPESQPKALSIPELIDRIGNAVVKERTTPDPSGTILTSLLNKLEQTQVTMADFKTNPKLPRMVKQLSEHTVEPIRTLASTLLNRYTRLVTDSKKTTPEPTKPTESDSSTVPALPAETNTASSSASIDQSDGESEAEVSKEQSMEDGGYEDDTEDIDPKDKDVDMASLVDEITAPQSSS